MVMQRREMVGCLCGDNINWPHQMKMLAKLQETYSDEDIVYAVDYYKNRGIPITSFGFLLYKDNMKDPCKLAAAERNICMQEGSSGERNKQRVRNNSKAYGGEEPYFSLFAESEFVN